MADETPQARLIAPSEALAVAMLAACEATIRHLWDIAGRFEHRECLLIRDEIHRLNMITLPAIQAAALLSQPAERRWPDEVHEYMNALFAPEASQRERPVCAKHKTPKRAHYYCLECREAGEKIVVALASPPVEPTPDPPKEPQ